MIIHTFKQRKPDSCEKFVCPNQKNVMEAFESFPKLLNKLISAEYFLQIMEQS